MATPRFHLFLMAAFALLAVVLASSGMYAVVAFNVVHRRREIGIRLAMGAAPEGVVAAFVRSGVALMVIGVATGLVAAWAGARYMAGVLYGVTPTDALTFAVVPMVLAVVAMAATYIPARRAADVAPMEALRAE
jgi:ABC-type antimicrobial peptide transport system permease subunit